ncbi:MAG TPA: glycosyltransferase family 4 protein [Pirellulales bacterium]|nr:glycosyltransferase family 4 protein [Pirellulales bacterium]
MIAKVRRDRTLLVVDTHDVVHLRDADLQRSSLPAEGGMTREEEIQHLEPFDLVIAIQNEEQKVLQEMLPDKRVIVAEHALETCPRRCRRKSLCFVGSNHSTNVASILPFIADSWQQIRARCPDALLEIVGSVCQNAGLAAAAAIDDRIVLRGVVPNTADIYDGPAAVICPLLVGSGLKIKLVESLAHGKATVASPIAAQGLTTGIGAGFVCAKSPSEFANAAVRLLTDGEYRNVWERAALAYAARFDPEAAYRELWQAIAPCLHAMSNGPDRHAIATPMTLLETA